jgi:hypothetical protein
MIDAWYANHVDEKGPAVVGSCQYQARKFHGGIFHRPSSCGNHCSFHLFDKVTLALLSGDQTTSILSFIEIILFGALQRLDQAPIILGGTNLLDHDASSEPGWNAKYGTEYVAEDFQLAIDYFGCGRTFVDVDEMDSGRARLQVTITAHPNACKRIHEGLT